MNKERPDSLSTVELLALKEKYGGGEEITLSGSLTQPIPALKIPLPFEKPVDAPARYEGQATGIPSTADLRRLSEHIRKTRPKNG